MKPGRELPPLQRWSLIGGLILAVVLVLAIVARVDDEILRWLKAFSVVALFAVALVARKHLPRLGWVVIALGFSAFGDLLLTGCLPVSGDLARVGGMAAFGVAYLALIAAFGGPVGRPELARLIPYAACGVLLVAALWPALAGDLRVGVPLFVALVVVMAWTLGLAPQRHFLSGRVAAWTAAAGLLLLASDAGVGFVMFAPPAAEASVWLDAFVRATYLVGWLLLLLVAVDPAPKASTLHWDAVAPPPRVGYPLAGSAT